MVSFQISISYLLAVPVDRYWLKMMTLILSEKIKRNSYSYVSDICWRYVGDLLVICWRHVGDLLATCPTRVGHLALPSPYMFLRYCPPTSYKAWVICPREQYFTVSINSA